MTVAADVPGPTNGVERVHERTVARHVLALFDGRQEGLATASRLRRFAELPLNHLGYVVQYHDVRTGLPDLQTLGHVKGVATWFVGTMGAGDGYLAWAAKAAEQGLRFVVLGDLGVDVTRHNRTLADDVMANLGLRHTGETVSAALGSRALIDPASGYGFECRLDPLLPGYPVLELANPLARALVQIRMPEPDNRQTPVVALGPRGGFAAFNFEFCHQSAPLHQGRWLIDPFTFFSMALNDRPFPIPDTTTLSGRRIVFAQVSSHGAALPLKSAYARGGHETAADAVVATAIEPYADIPVTLDLQPTDAARTERQDGPAVAALKRLLTLPHVSRPGYHVLGASLTRLDASFSSISNLAPIAVPDDPRVVMSPMSDEQSYRYLSRRLGLRPELAFYSLRETIDRTEQPRRLKPVTITYDLSIGGNPTSLTILRNHLEAVRQAPYIPIEGRRYGAIAGGFSTTTIEEVGELAWRILKRGDLQTVRFEVADDVTVDIGGSKGIVGHRRVNGMLYVALDATVAEPRLVLSVADVEPGGLDRLSLVESRWDIRRMIRQRDTVAFETSGFGAGEMVWRGPPHHRFVIAATRDGHLFWTGTATGDETGHLRFVVPLDGAGGCSIRITANP